MSNARVQKVLIAEDDIPLLDLYDKKFSSKGYEVIRAEDGGKAVESALAKMPDIMVLDLMMPVMNGFEVLKKVKAEATTKDIPVIILSNYGEMPNITEGMLAGAAEYLIKVEHTPEEVLEIVKDILAEKDSLVGKAFRETA
uniref:Response regulator n=1 Tax=candidate division WWE3 bacterium TaxID=2053526 RepID=A0A7C4TPF8_UNCKA